MRRRALDGYAALTWVRIDRKPHDVMQTGTDLGAENSPEIQRIKGSLLALMKPAGV
jgi:hypothetical protein